MECGSLCKKVRGHLLEGSMVMGLIKEGEGARVKNGARFNRVKRGESVSYTHLTLPTKRIV